MSLDRVKLCVQHYRKLGLCPLPSREDRKGPQLPTYAEHYGPTPVPQSVYQQWNTTNIQLITGTKSPTHTKILVVDCDGPNAIDKWSLVMSQHDYTPTTPWRSVTGSGGNHWYFRCPPAVTSCPSRLIWGLWDTWGETGRGKWSPHTEIRLLADNALVVAPPSIHVETGKHYEFAGDLNPNRIWLPEVAPQWLLDLPAVATPKTTPDVKREWVRPQGQSYTSDTGYQRDDVLDAIPDKLPLAISWGLYVLRDQPNANGWVQCYVPGRENPKTSKSASGSFQVDSGVLQDRVTFETMSLFDVAAQCGAFATWKDALAWCGDTYVGNLKRLPP